MEFWLVTTDHLTDRIWFRDDNDFKMGMNLVAILACVFSVDVLSFVLMSNHVHFVLRCSHEKAERFINEFKRLHSQYMAKKYGTKELLRKVRVQIDAISGMEESLEWSIAYVHMNPVAARICLHPTGYPWGTGNSFFRTTAAKGQRIDTLSKRKRIRLLHNKKQLPPHLLIGEDGYILPDSYVNKDFVETVFRTPARMGFFLQNSSKAKRRIESTETETPTFQDQLVISAIPNLCNALFHKSSLDDLNESETAELIKQLRFRFSSNVHQLMRVTGISYEIITQMLDRV